MRLGDLDALKDEISSWGCNDYDKNDFLEAIDNAPTVDCSNELGEMTFSHALTTEERQDLTRAFLIGKRTEQRPQGKWIMITEYDGFLHSKCSNCNQFNDWGDVPFCPWCGAEMIGGSK